MKRLRTLHASCAPALLALALLAPLTGIAGGVAEAQIPRPEKAGVALHTDRTAYEAGSKAKIAALVTIEPGWPDEKVQYPAHEMQTFAFAEQPLAVYDGEVEILAEIQVPKGTPAGEIPLQASLRYQACDDSSCLPPVTTQARVTLTVGAAGEETESAATFSTGGDAGGTGGAGDSLFLMLCLGLVGGLILNAMPCVLPVLSLKIFGLVRSAGHGRREVVRGTLATSAGILVSFWALAAAAVAARTAGAAVGWGVQFQHPGFVAFLAVIVVLFCLNLWGLFEIQLPWRVAQLGGSGAAREGAAGHFASGLFATLMATPCSAPFLGPALGFALSQEALQIFAMFTAVGLGMSLPYLVIAAAPGLARFLPKPGAWMETVRGFMGFLLAGAAVWLFYVLAAQVSPERVAGIKLALLALALFTWLRHRSLTGKAFRHAVAAAMVATVAVTLLLAHGGRAGATATTAAVAQPETPGLIAWEPFDRARAESLAAAGTMVFVDVTADWCFTCKFNEKLVLNTPEVAEAFEEHRVVPMKADWTNRDDRITQFLAEHGRYGIPFYLLYLPGGKPHVFGEIPSKDGLVEVVRNGARPDQVAAK
ncbi:MAG TPA: thioredoxin family protein [Thermoanaerobaculia bacterium]|nr:thioredoxin family protein [Thermoanaerobaculia bacterium]